MNAEQCFRGVKKVRRSDTDSYLLIAGSCLHFREFLSKLCREVLLERDRLCGSLHTEKRKRGLEASAHFGLNSSLELQGLAQPHTAPRDLRGGRREYIVDHVLKVNVDGMGSVKLEWPIRPRAPLLPASPQRTKSGRLFSLLLCGRHRRRTL